MKARSIKQLLAISALAIALPFSASSYAESGKHCNHHENKSGHGL
jgi:periplasmic protein CpxP/Spy